MFARLFQFLEDASLAKNDNNMGNGKMDSGVQRLIYQYRMHSEIVKWPNSYFYGNILKNGSISRVSIMKPYLFFNLNDTKENQANCDNSLWNDAEAKFVAKLAQAVCNKLASKEIRSDTAQPKTCGIITFYQKQRKTICLELEALGINVVDDFSNQGLQKPCHKNAHHNSNQAVSVKTVDGF